MQFSIEGDTDYGLGTIVRLDGEIQKELTGVELLVTMKDRPTLILTRGPARTQGAPIQEQRWVCACGRTLSKPIAQNMEG